MAVWLPVQCSHCRSTEVVKNGKSAEGKQRYRCQNADCPHRTFILNQVYPVVLQKDFMDGKLLGKEATIMQKFRRVGG